MRYDFRFHFQNKKQYSLVYLWDVHPTTFASWKGGYWGYFEKAVDALPSVGLFGELHFVRSRLRIDTIVHELDHLRTEWMWANGITITRKNEERMATFLDELVRNFLRELKKVHKLNL